MDEKPNCGFGEVNTREASLYEELEALPIEDVLKARLLSKLEILLSDKSELQTYLTRCYMEIDRMKATIVKLAMILPNCEV